MNDDFILIISVVFYYLKIRDIFFYIMNLDSAVKRYAENVSLIDQHANALTEVARLSGDNLEGNCFTNHATTQRNEGLLSKRINLLEVARHGKQILELGFNAGHSALLFLLGCQPDAEITFLDIGGHPYVLPCFEYLKRISPSIQRNMIIGNSLHLLPKMVLKEGQKEQYDIIHMDGGHGHECVINDLILLYMLLKPGGYLIVDDAEDFILEQVRNFVSLGLVEVEQNQFVTEVYPHIIVKKV
jgi:hypothetical protein